MSGMLWQKSGIEIDASVMNFLAGEDIILDRELLEFDIVASRAHAKGLHSIGALTSEECDDLCNSLDALAQDWKEGKFTLDDRYEDGHSAIESYLTEKLGPLGGKIHLGRSRNDQVLVALRMYMRASLDRIKDQLVECASASLERARTHEFDPMPGYTHLQRAVPSTVGLWFASFAESFTESATLVTMTRSWINRCPLGTAAGYGVNLPLAREEVAQDLGFESLVMNPMTAQASRGKHEHQTLSAVWQALQDVRRLAWDLSLFSTQEFAFVTMPKRTTTGSSIMPNKSNPDLVELLRASQSVVAGCMNELQQVLSLPSGYHRDLQLTKGPLIRAISTAIGALNLVPMLIRELEFHTDRMLASIEPAMHATDRAVQLAISGKTFREAYQMVADQGMNMAIDASSSVRSRISPGACGNLMLEELESRILSC